MYSYKKYTVYNLCRAYLNCKRIYLIRKTGYNTIICLFLHKRNIKEYIRISLLAKISLFYHDWLRSFKYWIIWNWFAQKGRWVWKTLTVLRAICFSIIKSFVLNFGFDINYGADTWQLLLNYLTQCKIQFKFPYMVTIPYELGLSKP